MWQRFNLDLAVFGLGIVLLLRLELFGGVDRIGAARTVDWLFLVAPLVILVGAAAVSLRVFPRILEAFSTLVSQRSGISAPLSFWYLARNSNQIAGLTMVLALAALLGVFGLALQTTLQVSETERARYAAGGDLRFQTSSGLQADNLTEFKDIYNTTDTWRTAGVVNLETYRSFPGFDLLAIEPFSMASVGVFREDFSDESMGVLLGRLVSEIDEPGIAIPGEPTDVVIWVSSAVSDSRPQNQVLDGDTDWERVEFSGKIRTNSGDTLLLSFQPGESVAFSPDGDTVWVSLFAAVPELPSDAYPIRLHSLWFRNRARRNGQLTGNVLLTIGLDAIGYREGPLAEPNTIEGFEDPLALLNHEIISLADGNPLFVYGKTEPYEGESLVTLFLSYDRSLEYIGLAFNSFKPQTDAVPALVSPDFLLATDLSIGDRVETWVIERPIPFEIKGIVEYFPTLYEEKPAGFLIAPSKILMPALEKNTYRPVNLNETWFELMEGSPADAGFSVNKGSVIRSWDAELITALIQSDPLASGLRGTTFLGAVITTGLSIIGFLSFFSMSVRQRITSFGILRALGISTRQLYLSLAIEQFTIIISGVGLGVLMGWILSQIVIPGLPITTGNQLPIPPLVPQTNIQSAWGVAVLFLGIFSLTFSGAIWFLWRRKIHTALRIGQE